MSQSELVLSETVVAEIVSPKALKSIPRIAFVAILVAAGDICIYQGDGGYTGWALFAVVALLLIVFGIGRWRFSSVNLCVLSLILLSAARLVWLGNLGIVVAVSFQLLAMAMTQHGMMPFIPELGAFVCRIIPCAVIDFPEQFAVSLGLATNASRGRWLAWGLPAVICFAFMVPFLLANPDQITWFVEGLERLADMLWSWWANKAISELVLWIVLGTIGMGVLSPQIAFSRRIDIASKARNLDPLDSMWYVPVRNSLLGVIAVFTLYLTFEFQSLWFRDFPENFHYSGYAHQGAAWLTVALGMTTVVLSLMFQGNLLDDRRIKSLHRLAWMWSMLNFILAVSVYHRMWIYVGFNGMTRMRIVGFFGITCVVIGFGLVVWKIRHGRSLAWLLQYQLLALAIMSSLLAVTPMDSIAYSYNTRQILAGNPAPAVQITEHLMTADGWLAVWPLTEASDQVVRDGVRAYLAEYIKPPRSFLRTIDIRRSGWQWFQASETRLMQKLSDNAPLLEEFGSDVERRQAAIELFRSTAYKWY